MNDSGNNKRITFKHIKALCLYCGLTSDQYRSIRGEITRRNERVLYLSATATIALGAVLFLANMLSSSMAIYPCLSMIVSGALILATGLIPRKKPSVVTGLCYTLLVLLLASSAATSFLRANRAIPATTFVAFLALIPLLIKDSPLRMTPVILGSGAAYIALSGVFKEPSAFRLDIFNTITFAFIGIFLYVIMMRWAATEIWQQRHVKELQDGLVVALGTVIEARDGVTGEHVMHTTMLVGSLVDAIKKLNKYPELPASFFENVRRAAALHDIGKIQTPDAILSKPARLTPEEFEIIKQHASRGADIIAKAAKNAEDSGFFGIAYNIVKYHHERYDGTGYPDGLKAVSIPLEARIMALADVYDALISPRPYKQAVPPEEALRIIKEGRGTQFDPELTDIFVQTVSAPPPADMPGC